MAPAQLAANELGVIVEGLGMSVLRLIANDAILAEYHFTLRYAREVAKLHRQMERHMSRAGTPGAAKSESEAPGESPKPDEKRCVAQSATMSFPHGARSAPPAPAGAGRAGSSITSNRTGCAPSPASCWRS